MVDNISTTDFCLDCYQSEFCTEACGRLDARLKKHCEAPPLFEIGTAKSDGVDLTIVKAPYQKKEKEILTTMELSVATLLWRGEKKETVMKRLAISPGQYRVVKSRIRKKLLKMSEDFKELG